MGFLKNIVRNAVSDGISKGIRDAVSSAAESIVAPKAEAYANKVADSLNSATEGLDSAASPADSAATEKKSAFSSLEESLNRMSQAAEKYAAAMETKAASMESLAKEWNERLPGFPVWCFGATNYWFDENGKSSDGNTYHLFNTEGSTQEDLNMYVALLKDEGFVQRWKGSDEILYKDLGGEYLVLGTTEAFGAAPVMTLAMFRTKDRSEFEN